MQAVQKLISCIKPTCIQQQVDEGAHRPSPRPLQPSSTAAPAEESYPYLKPHTNPLRNHTDTTRIINLSVSQLIKELLEAIQDNDTDRFIALNHHHAADALLDTPLHHGKTPLRLAYEQNALSIARWIKGENKRLLFLKPLRQHIKGKVWKAIRTPEGKLILLRHHNDQGILSVFSSHNDASPQFTLRQPQLHSPRFHQETPLEKERRDHQNRTIRKPIAALTSEGYLGILMGPTQQLRHTDDLTDISTINKERPLTLHTINQELFAIVVNHRNQPELYRLKPNPDININRTLPIQRSFDISLLDDPNNVIYSKDNVLIVKDPNRTPKSLHRIHFEDNSEEISYELDASISRDGNHLLLVNQNTLQVIDLNTKSQLTIPINTADSFYTVSPNGRFIVKLSFNETYLNHTMQSPELVLTYHLQIFDKNTLSQTTYLANQHPCADYPDIGKSRVSIQKHQRQRTPNRHNHSEVITAIRTVERNLDMTFSSQNKLLLTLPQKIGTDFQVIEIEIDLNEEETATITQEPASDAHPLQARLVAPATVAYQYSHAAAVYASPPPTAPVRGKAGDGH